MFTYITSMISLNDSEVPAGRYWNSRGKNRSWRVEFLPTQTVVCKSGMNEKPPWDTLSLRPKGRSQRKAFSLKRLHKNQQTTCWMLSWDTIQTQYYGSPLTWFLRNIFINFLLSGLLHCYTLDRESHVTCFLSKLRSDWLLRLRSRPCANPDVRSKVNRWEDLFSFFFFFNRCVCVRITKPAALIP